jgi:hypothetical protein
MHLAPVFSRKLGLIPLDMGHPAWVHLDAVDLDFHMRKVKGQALPQVQHLTQVLVAALEEGRSLLVNTPVAKATKKQSAPPKATPTKPASRAKAATVKTSVPRSKPPEAA